MIMIYEYDLWIVNYQLWIMNCRLWIMIDDYDWWLWFMSMIDDYDSWFSDSFIDRLIKHSRNQVVDAWIIMIT